MKLRQLLKSSPEIEVRGSKEVEVTGITADSRTAAPGHLFIAKKGSTYDGSQFIQQAIQAGASVVATDLYDPFLEKTQIITEELSGLEALLAARFYDYPSKELFVVGITGTKGKTTTSYLIRHLLEGLGISTGLVGTVETIIKEKRIDSTLTTHDVIKNQKLLREMVLQGCKGAVLEVSSHGLDQNRVDEIDFSLAVFTNLFADHLDYHKEIEEYAKAKRKLFRRLKEGNKAILNRDSPYFDFMKEEREALSFGIEKSADVMAKEIELSLKGSKFLIEAFGEKAYLKTDLIGRFNIYNLLAAISVGLELKRPLEEIASILSSFQNVPGRLERVPSPFGFEVFVDFAHVGEALENVLSTLKESVKGKLFVVFGAGGNRPPDRRATMAKAAEKWADLSIVTTDNPRNEDPEKICQEILSSFKNPQKALLEIDRKKAIFQAISLAKEGDIVLIAGKGHEKVQIFAHQTLPFDDVEIAKEAILCHSALF